MRGRREGGRWMRSEGGGDGGGWEGWRERREVGERVGRKRGREVGERGGKREGGKCKQIRFISSLTCTFVLVTFSRQNSMNLKSERCSV